MSEHRGRAAKFVPQPCLESVGPDERGCGHAGSLHQWHNGPDNSGEYGGTIWILGPEVRLHADHPQRSQASLPKDRPQPRAECRLDSGSFERLTQPLQRLEYKRGTSEPGAR